MASQQVVFPLLVLTLVLVAAVDCYVVLKGSVSCLDCAHNAHHDLSGIKVSVKCSHDKNLVTATTESDGSFQTILETASGSCSSRILGATRQQLYVPKTTSESPIILKANKPGLYATSEPLRFYAKCPNTKCGAQPGSGSGSGLGSSKTVDLPVPKEWGIAPTSYYLPFIPIIGIP